MTEVLQPYPILQDHLRETPWSSPATARLPGTGPLDQGDWLRLDEAYGGQMALRERLIARHRDQVHALLDAALPAAQELLQVVLDDLRGKPGFTVSDSHVTRPDGQTVALDTSAPLITLGQLVPQDFCILQRHGAEHVLSGAILCFPASWRLSEKINRPLTTIHDPVASYDDGIARRVQRLFDAVQADRPLWRVNLLVYQDFDLYHPRAMAERRVQPNARAPYVRSERQCISRLPQTGAMVFAIHTTIVRRETLSAADQAALGDYLAARHLA